MLKKWFIFVLAMVAFNFAQDVNAPASAEQTGYVDMSAYTSGAPAPETPTVTINEVASSDPVFYVSLHPVTLLFWWSIFDIPDIQVTFEGCIGPSFSVVTHPEFLYWSDSRTVGGRNTSFNEDVSLYIFGITEGIRYYFGAHHKGLYVEPQFIYEHLGLDYHYAGNDKEDMDVSANAFGGALVAGYKIVVGHFTMASDIGLSYVYASAKGEFRDDIEEASTVGWGYTGNFSIGYAF